MIDQLILHLKGTNIVTEVALLTNLLLLGKQYNTAGIGLAISEVVAESAGSGYEEHLRRTSTVN